MAQRHLNEFSPQELGSLVAEITLRLGEVATREKELTVQQMRTEGELNDLCSERDSLRRRLKGIYDHIYMRGL